MSDLFRRLTVKRLMLILMCTLLVLAVVMAMIVGGKVMALLSAFIDPDGNTTSTGDSNVPQTSESTEATPPTSSNTEQTTQPTQTEPVESTEGHVHEFVKGKTTSATCTSMGYTVYHCSCGATDIRDFRDQLGHQYQEEVVPQGCEQEGCTLKSCVRCGDVQKTDIKLALGHDYQLVQTVVGSCEVDGYDEYQCTRCGELKKENVQPAPGHTYGQWTVTKPATETAPGEQHKTCEVCDHEETQIIPATGDLKIIGSPSEIHDTDENWTHHRIQVGIGTNFVYTYDIYIGLEDRNISCTYTKESGLVVTYTTGMGEKQQMMSAYEDGILAVDQDGNVTHAAPSMQTQTPAESEATPPPSTEETTTPTDIEDRG